jgi:preprotein translocase subunit YajC
MTGDILGIPIAQLGITGLLVLAVVGLFVLIIRSKDKQYNDMVAAKDLEYSNMVALKDGQITQITGVKNEWYETASAANTRADLTTEALNKALDANKTSDRLWDVMVKSVTSAPKMGDNDPKPLEGVTPA